MKISFWKKILSYFDEVLLESTQSAFNESLFVTLNKGRIQLSTPDAIYSYADKYDNFKKSFDKIKLEANNDVLLLGFGLGSIPFMLEKKFNLNYNYVGVEIDEQVIYLASKYVLSDLKSDIQVIQADAEVFLIQDRAKYDIIAMDIFISDHVPEQFETEEFLNMLKESLTAKGFVMYNRLNQTDQDQKKNEHFYATVFNKIFPNASYLDIKGNRMLISKNEILK